MIGVVGKAAGSVEAGREDTKRLVSIANIYIFITKARFVPSLTFHW